MPSAVSAKSIAVLPFVNMSGDSANEYFSDGISEEILNVLARVPDLSVAARTSSFQFKGEKRDVEQIAAQLKVRMVLEGSVRKQADRVRITAQLIDAQTGYHLWSQTYDRDLNDIFAIQDEIARAIGDELKVRVIGAGAAGTSVGGTKSLQAHDLYLRGLAQWQTRNADGLLAARESFEQAIAADPGYADAWAGLALGLCRDLRLHRADFRRGRRITHSRGGRASAGARPDAGRGLRGPRQHRGQRDLHLDTGVVLLKRAIALKPSFATAQPVAGNDTGGKRQIAKGPRVARACASARSALDHRGKQLQVDAHHRRP